MRWMILLSTLGFMFASCSDTLTPYTGSVQRSAGLDEAKLKNIQFYLSGDIVLQRELSGSEATISQGELKLVNGREVQEIRIPSGTPGLVVGLEQQQLLVSFDADGSYLRFGPNPGAGGRYTVMATDWDGRVGSVNYGGQTFWVVGNSQYAHLLLDMERHDEVTIQRKEASGRTLTP